MCWICNENLVYLQTTNTILDTKQLQKAQIMSGSRRKTKNWLYHKKEKQWLLNNIGPPSNQKQKNCNKDMGFYSSSILFTFHYLAFILHDSFPCLSVGNHVTINLLTPLPPLHLLLSGCVISQLILIGKWYCIIRSLTLLLQEDKCQHSWSKQILSDLQWYPFLHLYPTSWGFPKG